MAVNRVTIKEGNTGILYLSKNNGTEDRYIPDYSLDDAKKLLLEFQEHKSINNISIKNNYVFEGIDWYPTVINYLYNTFHQYAKYKSLIEQIIDGELTVGFENKGSFYNIVSSLNGGKEGNFIKKRIFNFLLKINNKRVVKKYEADILFFKYTSDDFRTSSVKKIFDGDGIKYIEAIGASRQLLLENLFTKKPYYFYGGIVFQNLFDHKYNYDFSCYDRYKKFLFEKALNKIEWIISASIREYKIHCAHLANTKVKIFYGIDDTHVVYPLLYACQRNHIRTVAHQHGAAYNKRHASYIMEGIDKKNYKWFETLIVWGEFWRDQLLSNSKVYDNKMFVIGSSLFSNLYPTQIETETDHRNILVPYEFLTNTFSIGKYISKLIDLGYNIYFKPRPDEVLKDQLDAYCLDSAHASKIKIVHNLTPEFMQQISIVAGSMSTLIFQLFPYKKIIWVFDTEYKYMDDLVELGYAHKIKFEELEKLDKKYFTRTEINAEYFFFKENLKDTLYKHVLNGNGSGKLISKYEPHSSTPH